jgi:hypothetical protein
MRGNLRYTPTRAVQQEPMKSAREGNCFRLVSDGVVHRSRTITRTISKQRNRRGKKVSRCQHGWVVPYLNLSHAGSHAGLPVAPSEFDLGTRRHIWSLLQGNGPLAFVSTDNQGKDRQFHVEKLQQNRLSGMSASACIPDVLLQAFGLCRLFVCVR